jgi:phosphoglycolate phosphatase
MKKYRAAIWDWNGTLLDDVDLALEIVNELLTEHNLPILTSERYKDIFDFPVRLYYERAGFDLTRFSFEIVSQTFCQRFEERLHRASLVPSATEVLQAMQRFGYRQFLLSGTEHHTLQRMTRHFGLADAFEAVQGLPDGLAEGKLASARKLLNQFQIEPSEGLMIGDTLHDAEVAETLGLDCLLISSGHHSHERLSESRAKVFRSLDDVLASEFVRDAASS